MDKLCSDVQAKCVKAFINSELLPLQMFFGGGFEK